ncbi:hypothetical protein MTR67_043361 [Solanum verrucosum]|uniref:Uncharacterized protein n=1 Tax=Solanum verrucosum TaxID=315347 RepID=A0AAF0URU5_SOLVR|nr:hypothetical protein MTR67_043361 [Solanum verrucosum]
MIEGCTHETKVTLVQWNKPQNQWIKLNADHSALSNPGRVGAGGYQLLNHHKMEDIEKVGHIKEKLRMAQSRKKSYAELRRRDLEVEVKDWAYMKISPLKGVMRFGKKGKRSPQYVGPYQILRRV